MMKSPVVFFDPMTGFGTLGIFRKCSDRFSDLEQGEAFPGHGSQLWFSPSFRCTMLRPCPSAVFKVRG